MLYLIPFAAAFAGWLLHKVFIYFICEKIIPARQEVIASNVAEYAASTINLEHIAAHLTDAGQLSALKPEIERHIDIFLNEKLKEKMPMIAMFVGEKTIDKIKEGLLEEIDILLPVILGKFAGNLDKQIDLRALVYKKISKMDKKDFVDRIKHGGAGNYIKRFALLGALSGFITGWICLICFMLIQH